MTHLSWEVGRAEVVLILTLLDRGRITVEEALEKIEALPHYVKVSD